MISLAFVAPNVFAAAYFAVCMVIGGAIVCSLLLVVACLLRRGKR